MPMNMANLLSGSSWEHLLQADRMVSKNCDVTGAKADDLGLEHLDGGSVPAVFTGVLNQRTPVRRSLVAYKMF
ncbi:unnamed protein product [Urochloa humidicola]